METACEAETRLNMAEQILIWRKVSRLCSILLLKHPCNDCYCYNSGLCFSPGEISSELDSAIESDTEPDSLTSASESRLRLQNDFVMIGTARM
ncbi:hypothetical protein Y1Q_0017260 [Alligator mississippiensis]|uniref:Uncharacterized protein n=1 Tax=Alligator mississippiensis TaxID=8496 RepID=A0A151NL28_ALLMI|nr:hypothetical protein Y1Q_0017260 [Alligator mississippiensis]